MPGRWFDMKIIFFKNKQTKILVNTKENNRNVKIYFRMLYRSLCCKRKDFWCWNISTINQQWQKNPMNYSIAVMICVKIYVSIRSTYPVNTKGKKKGKKGNLTQFFNPSFYKACRLLMVLSFNYLTSFHWRRKCI